MIMCVDVWLKLFLWFGIWLCMGAGVCVCVRTWGLSVPMFGCECVWECKCKLCLAWLWAHNWDCGCVAVRAKPCAFVCVLACACGRAGELVCLRFACVQGAACVCSSMRVWSGVCVNCLCMVCLFRGVCARVCAWLCVWFCLLVCVAYVFISVSD